MPPATLWLTLGDFNVVYQMSECSNYFLGMPIPNKVQEFQNCIREVGLVDIPCSGPLFTWSNRGDDGFLAKKLDKAMANSQWLLELSDYEAQFLAPDTSDHSAGWIALKSPTAHKCRPFKFFSYLIQHDDFHTVVHNSWLASSAYGTRCINLARV